MMSAAETLTDGVYRVLQDYTFDMLDVIESHLATERIGQTERGRMTSQQQEEFDKIRKCMDKLANSLQNGFEESFRTLEAHIAETFNGVETSALLIATQQQQQQAQTQSQSSSAAQSIQSTPHKDVRGLVAAIQEQRRVFIALSEQIDNALAERQATLARIAEKQAQLRTAREVNSSVVLVKKAAPSSTFSVPPQSAGKGGGYTETLNEMEVEAIDIENTVRSIYTTLDN